MTPLDVQIYSVVAIVLGLVTVAPLMIWRNTNRTNNLLMLIAIKQGVDIQKILKAMGEETHGPNAMKLIKKIQD